MLYLISSTILLFVTPSNGWCRLEFVTDPFPPYYYIENNVFSGIQYELADLTFKKMGHPFTLKFLPWQRALMTAQCLSTDGIFGLRKTEERERWLIYPDEPLMTVRTVIFSRARDNFKYTGVASLKGKKVGATQGYTYGEPFDNSTAFQKEQVKSLQLNFLKLMAGRVDLVAAYRAVGLYTLEKMNLTEHIESSQQPIQSMPMYLGFSKKPGNGKLAKEFSRVLKEIKSSPQCNELISRYGMDSELITPCYSEKPDNSGMGGGTEKPDSGADQYNTEN